MPFCKLLHIENENWTWNFDTEMSLRYIVILDQPHHFRCPFFWLLLMMSDVGIVKWVNKAGYFRKKLSSAIIMIKYNHDFWPLCIFSSDHLYITYYKERQMFLQSPTGLITQSATEGKRSLMIKEDGDYFFSFNQLPAFRLEYLNVIYWNALIASIILLCLLYFWSSSFSFEQQN